MRYRADKESLAHSREMMLERAQEEYDRRVNFLFDYYGRFLDKPEKERLEWYRLHDDQGPLAAFLMEFEKLGPWQAKEAKKRLTDAARLYEKYGIVPKEAAGV